MAFSDQPSYEATPKAFASRRLGRRVTRSQATRLPLQGTPNVKISMHHKRLMMSLFDSLIFRFARANPSSPGSRRAECQKGKQ